MLNAHIICELHKVLLCSQILVRSYSYEYFMKLEVLHPRRREYTPYYKNQESVKEIYNELKTQSLRSQGTFCLATNDHQHHRFLIVNCGTQRLLRKKVLVTMMARRVGIRFVSSFPSLFIAVVLCILLPQSHTLYS